MASFQHRVSELITKSNAILPGGLLLDEVAELCRALGMLKADALKAINRAYEGDPLDFAFQIGDVAIELAAVAEVLGIDLEETQWITLEQRKAKP